MFSRVAGREESSRSQTFSGFSSRAKAAPTQQLACSSSKKQKLKTALVVAVVGAEVVVVVVDVSRIGKVVVVVVALVAVAAGVIGSRRDGGDDVRSWRPCPRRWNLHRFASLYNTTFCTRMFGTRRVATSNLAFCEHARFPFLSQMFMPANRTEHSHLQRFARIALQKRCLVAFVEHN